MSLTPTAQRMLSYLPDYYSGNRIMERIVQGWADEVDRADAMIDTLIEGMIPTTATDDLGLLAIWERTLQVPVAPAGPTIEQRQGNLAAQLQTLDAVTGGDVLALLEDAIGPGVTIDRNTPGALMDTINISFDPGTYQAGRTEQIARKVWSAHRRVFVHYGDGTTAEVDRYATFFPLP